MGRGGRGRRRRESLMPRIRHFLGPEISSLGLIVSRRTREMDPSTPCVRGPRLDSPRIMSAFPWPRTITPNFRPETPPKNSNLTHQTPSPPPPRFPSSDPPSAVHANQRGIWTRALLRRLVSLPQRAVSLQIIPRWAANKSDQPLIKIAHTADRAGL